MISSSKILWTSAHLTILREFTRAKFREGDYNSIFGSLWNLLNPLLMLLVLYCIFNARFGLIIENYALFILVGVVCVGFVTSAGSQAIPSLTRAQELLINSTTPAKCIVFADLIFVGSKFIIEISLCILASILFGTFAWQDSFYLVILICLFFAMVTGISLILALASCLVRDVIHIWLFASKLLLFGTPIFYSLRDLSEWARILVYWGNPLTPFVLSFQQFFINSQSINSFMYIHCIVLASVFLSLGLFLFERYSRNLIERA